MSFRRDQPDRSMPAHPITSEPSDMPDQPPAPHYEIRVRGHLGPTLRHAFADLQADRCAGNTTLRGPVPDQSALHGLLAQIEALGLELLEVRRLPDGPTGG
jgi:hypothetical protein